MGLEGEERLCSCSLKSQPVSAFWDMATPFKSEISLVWKRKHPRINRVSDFKL